MLLYAAPRNSNKGFTLIEMITTVIIVGVLAAIAAPNLLGLLNKTRVKDGLGQVEGAIREAQRLAIRRGRPCTIDFTTTGGISRVSTSNQGCLLSTRELPQDISFGNPNSVTFSAKGSPSITGSTTVSEIIIVSHPQVTDRKCIQIEGLLGNIISGDFDPSDNSCTPNSL